MNELITKDDFNFDGSSLEVADNIIQKCNQYDSMIDKAGKLVAIERGRAYSYAKVKLNTNVALAERYNVDEKSIRNYIDIFNGRKFIESECVPNDTGVNKLVKTAKTGKAKAKVEAMVDDVNTDDYTDAEIITISKMKPSEAKEHIATEAANQGNESSDTVNEASTPPETATNDVRTATDIFKELDAKDKVIMFNHIETITKEANEYGINIQALMVEYFFREVVESTDEGLVFDSFNPAALPKLRTGLEDWINHCVIDDGTVEFKSKTIEKLYVEFTKVYRDINSNKVDRERITTALNTGVNIIELSEATGVDAGSIVDVMKEDSLGILKYKESKAIDKFIKKPFKPTVTTDDTSKPSTPHVTDTIIRTDVDTGEEVTFKDAVDAALNTVAKKSKNGEPVRDNHSVITKASKGVNNNNTNPNTALGYSWKKGA